MNWILKYLGSSLGQKILMSLTGLFLVQFLAIHLLGNIQLLYPDGGVKFNEYSAFMSEFVPIKIVSYLLYASIILHAFVGIASAINNKKARGGQGYAKKAASGTSFAARNMALLGTMVLFFIIIHMSQFWFNSKFGAVKAGELSYYEYAVEIFSNPIWVAVYVIGQIVLFLHLSHGFQSAFQTLGLNHNKYSPIVKAIGYVISVAFPLGFAAVAIGMYLKTL